jgi:predicted DNA-binding transcriptional regulator AlpA
MKKSLTASAALAGFDQLPDSAHVRLPVVMALFGVAPATVWRRCRDGTIPPPLRIGPRVTAWQVGALRLALKKIGA